jgi:ATP-binding cassette subfamily F protein uup
LTKFNYVDQARIQLREERTVLEEVSDGTEFVVFGEGKLSLRAYLKRFLFADDRMTTQVKHLSGGERSRLLLARILKNGGNFLILDEPTNDLDLPTLRVLEEALIAFPGVVLVVSHDRYFLNRVCTDVLAFEGNERVAHSVGDYDYYLEKKLRTPSPVGRERLGVRAGARWHEFTVDRAPRKPDPPSREVGETSDKPKPAKPRKLSFKESRELEGMEAKILAREADIVRIELLFATPDFHRTHGTRTEELKSELAAAKAEVANLYERWQELEAIKVESEQR